MKRVKVSALRSKRGLRPVEQVAEPPVVGFTAQTTMMTERTTTMKSYLLRNSKTVDAQNRATPRRPARRKAARDESGTLGAGKSASLGTDPVLYVGLTCITTRSPFRSRPVIPSRCAAAGSSAAGMTTCSARWMDERGGRKRLKVE